MVVWQSKRDKITKIQLKCANTKLKGAKVQTLHMERCKRSNLAYGKVQKVKPEYGRVQKVNLEYGRVQKVNLEYGKVQKVKPVNYMCKSTNIMDPTKFQYLMIKISLKYFQPSPFQNERYPARECECA